MEFTMVPTSRLFFKIIKKCNIHLRQLHTSTKLIQQSKLTPHEVTEILRANEYTKEFAGVSIKSYDSNQLPSNSPIEDTRSEGKCILTGGILIGVFDGHGGAACAQVIAKRLLKYITMSLLPRNLLQEYLSSLQNNNDRIKVIEYYNDKYELVNELKILYKKSFFDYIEYLLQNHDENFNMEVVLEKAFLRLDRDLSNEALTTNNSEGVNLQTVSVAESGAVACVAHIDGPHLHVASAGDCQAVLGVLTEEDTWIAKTLTVEHNAYNISEVTRIQNEHPECEKDTVIRSERLLGQLAPLRAFGDVRFKWSVKELNTIVAPYFGRDVVAHGYYTPPYLTARPEITYHRLTPRDKFLIIASDGLWDMLSPLQAVTLVGEHMFGKITLSPFKLPDRKMKLKEIHDLLLHRKRGLDMKPVDSNAATHLLRNALGGTEFGVEHNKLSSLLTLPPEVSRLFRDDITITVVYFDSEYLRNFHR